MSALPPKADKDRVRGMSGPNGRVQFLIYALVARSARRNPAVGISPFAKGRRGPHRHSRGGPCFTIRRTLPYFGPTTSSGVDAVTGGARRIDLPATSLMTVCRTTQRRRNLWSVSGSFAGGLLFAASAGVAYQSGGSHRRNRNCLTDLCCPPRGWARSRRAASKTGTIVVCTRSIGPLPPPRYRWLRCPHTALVPSLYRSVSALGH